MSEFLNDYVNSVIHKDGVEHINDITDLFDKRLIMINRMVLHLVRDILIHHKECSECDDMWHNFKAIITEDVIKNKGEVNLLTTMIEYKLTLDFNIISEMKYKRNKDGFTLYGKILKDDAENAQN